MLWGCAAVGGRVLMKTLGLGRVGVGVLRAGLHGAGLGLGVQLHVGV